MSGERDYFSLPAQRVILEKLDLPGRILDIGGGGEGIIGQVYGERVVAIDRKKSELLEAPSGPLKIVMDARDLQFLDETFEAATAFFSLMYVREKVGCRHIMDEVWRVLKPGGRFLIWDAAMPTRSVQSVPFVVLPLKVQLPDREVETGYGVRWPSEEKGLAYYERLALGAGFEVATRQEEGRLFRMKLRKPISSC